jgi:hypothetical protein
MVYTQFTRKMELTIGNVTFHRLSHEVHPSMDAASYMLLGIVWRPERKTMIWKKISIETDTTSLLSQRPESFSDFVGQDPIKAVLATAIDSAQKRQ